MVKRPEARANGGPRWEMRVAYRCACGGNDAGKPEAHDGPETHAFLEDGGEEGRFGDEVGVRGFRGEVLCREVCTEAGEHVWRGEEVVDAC